MAVSAKNNVVLWEDIQDLYTALNAVRSKFSFSQVTAPTLSASTEKITNEQLSNLSNYITGMKTNKYLKNATITNITVPNQYDIVTPNPFIQVKTAIDDMNRVCAFDAAFFASCFGFCDFTFNADFCDFSQCDFSDCWCDFGFNGDFCDFTFNAANVNFGGNGSYLGGMNTGSVVCDTFFWK